MAYQAGNARAGQSTGTYSAVSSSPRGEYGGSSSRRDYENAPVPQTGPRYSASTCTGPLQMRYPKDEEEDPMYRKYRQSQRRQQIDYRLFTEPYKLN